MGELFQLYDTSGDGWLQYSEFQEFMSAISPDVPQTDTEELFLSSAEEATGDMTKEVFLNLVMRLGITSDVDMLEDLVNARHTAMNCDRSQRTRRTLLTKDTRELAAELNAIAVNVE